MKSSYTLEVHYHLFHTSSLLLTFFHPLPSTVSIPLSHVLFFWYRLQRHIRPSFIIQRSDVYIQCQFCLLSRYERKVKSCAYLHVLCHISLCLHVTNREPLKRCYKILTLRNYTNMQLLVPVLVKLRQK